MDPTPLRLVLQDQVGEVAPGVDAARVLFLPTEVRQRPAPVRPDRACPGKQHPRAVVWIRDGVPSAVHSDYDRIGLAQLVRHSQAEVVVRRGTGEQQTLSVEEVLRRLQRLQARQTYPLADLDKGVSIPIQIDAEVELLQVFPEIGTSGLFLILHPCEGAEVQVQPAANRATLPLTPEVDQIQVRAAFIPPIQQVQPVPRRPRVGEIRSVMKGGAAPDLERGLGGLGRLRGHGRCRQHVLARREAE